MQIPFNLICCSRIHFCKSFCCQRVHFADSHFLPQLILNTFNLSCLYLIHFNLFNKPPPTQLPLTTSFLSSDTFFLIVFFILFSFYFSISSSDSLVFKDFVRSTYLSSILSEYLTTILFSLPQIWILSKYSAPNNSYYFRLMRWPVMNSFL